MKSLKKLFPVAFVLISQAACSKTSVPAVPNEPTPKDTTVALLESSDWHITTLTVTPAQNGVTDVWASLPPCLTDNFFRFKAGGIFNSDEGLTKCNPAIPQIDEGTWSYIDGSKLLNFNSQGWQNRKLNITATTSTTISGTDDKVENGVAYTYTITLTKQ